MDLKEYAKKKKVEIKEVRTSYAFALFRSIVLKTPVGNPDFDKDSGRARANWQITKGSPANGVVEKERKGLPKKDEVPVVNGDESIFITNNLPYITTLEYGKYPNPPKVGSHTRKGVKPSRTEVLSVNGFSKQAPEGMVGVTLANNENIFNSAVRAVKGSKR